MKRTKSNFKRVFALISLAMVAACLTGTSTADAQVISDPMNYERSDNRRGQTSKQTDDTLFGDARPARSKQTLRQRRFKKYQNINELMSTEPPQYDLALEELLKMDYDKVGGSGNLTRYEKAVFLNMIATIYKSQEKYDLAIEYYKKVLDQSPDLPYDLEDGVNFTIGQIYYITSQYGSSVEYLNKWLIHQSSPPSNNLIFIANAYYSAGATEGISSTQSEEHFRTAVALINQAIAYEEALGKQGRENWYVVLRMLHHNLEEHAIVLEISELLVSRWPGKKEYWTELSGLYAREAAVEERSEAEKSHYELLQMVTFETAHRQNMLNKAQELESMSQLFLYHDVPYKSSKTLNNSLDREISEPTFKNYNMLSMAYLEGKDLEKALFPLSRAAELADDGEHYMRLANLQLQLDNYDEAVIAIDRAIDKGGINRPDLARFVQGQALMYLERFDEARAAFSEAAEDERTTKNARTWLEYIDKEEKRIRDINEYLR